MPVPTSRILIQQKSIVSMPEATMKFFSAVLKQGSVYQCGLRRRMLSNQNGQQMALCPWLPLLGLILVLFWV